RRLSNSLRVVESRRAAWRCDRREKLASGPHYCGPTYVSGVFNLVATEAEGEVGPVSVSIRIVSARTISVIRIIAPPGAVTIIAVIRIAIAQAVIIEPGISIVRIPGTTSPVTITSPVTTASRVVP